MSVVMAGSGLVVSVFNLSIIQLLRFRARRCVSDASASGTVLKRLPERSRDCKVPATGARLATLISVRLFSARLR